MYLFELVADDLCGTVTSLRRRRRWRALPCWDPCGGLAWAPRAAPVGDHGRAFERRWSGGHDCVWPGRGCSCFSFELIAHGQSRRRRRLFPGPGQVWWWPRRSIPRNAGVAAAALTDAGFVELRLLTVVWALDRQDDDPSGIAEFGGE